MKTKIFSFVIVLMLIMMACSNSANLPPEVAQPIGWPTTWIGLSTDANESGCDRFRNVADNNTDSYALYYATDSQYLYLRMETVDPPGWPSTKPEGDARYKWWFDTAGNATSIKGTTVYEAEFLLILEDLRDNSNDPNVPRDQLGELTLIDDLNNAGFTARWDSANPPNYTINNAQTAPTGNSTWWRRELGSGTAGVGGPQGVMGMDIGYRIDNINTGGNFVDMYVSWAALGNPPSLCLIWATDNQDNNLDQAPNCDRPTGTSCLSVCIPPIADFHASNTSPCANEAVTFTDNSTGSPTSWSWDVDGDGIEDYNTQNPSHTYTNAGTYTMSLTVSNACSSDTETKTNYITVYTRPIAAASSNSPVSEGATIQLYGNPDGMTSYNWSGPGGWTSSLQNPTRTGATTAMAGTYTLTVTNGNGCTNDESTSVTVSTTELFDNHVCCSNHTISSTEGGSVTTPGEGAFYYVCGMVVELVASPDPGYKFVNWSGDVARIADVYNASTTITMCGNYGITANFEPEESGCNLTIASTEGGSVTAPGEGTSIYEADTVVDLLTQPDEGYQFMKWTGDVSTIADIYATSTTITMKSDYSITANFQLISPIKYNLTLSGTTGGSVTSPGEGTFVYNEGTVVAIAATPDPGYRFTSWLGDVDTVADVNAVSTTITMDANYCITGAFGFRAVGGCFIATAAYGTPTTEQIDVLREFRDVVLLESTAGSQFVALYYQLSPPIADFISGNELLRTLVRELLVNPFVWVVEATGEAWRN